MMTHSLKKSDLDYEFYCILIAFKTKNTKKNFQYHFQCSLKEDCPFQVKLSESKGNIDMFCSGNHSHEKNTEEIGIIHKNFN